MTALTLLLFETEQKNISSMIKKQTPHKIPTDLQKALASQTVKTAWKNITPLARNEWICWIESAKKQETRNHRIERTRSELVDGKRRPCCWAGCPHR